MLAAPPPEDFPADPCRQQRGVRRLVAGLLLCLALHCQAETAPDWLLPPMTTGPSQVNAAVGALAPGFDLPREQGGSLNLASLRGEVVVLVFWASWCPHCRRWWPVVHTLQDFHSGEDLRVLGLVVWDGIEAARSYHREHGLQFELLAASDELAAAYAVVSTPTTIVVDRDGRITARILGADPDDERLESAVSAALAAVAGSGRG